MRIALLTHSVHPRGGVVHALSLGEALQAAGQRVTVFAPAAPGERMFRDGLRCAVELVPLPPEPADAAAAPALADRIGSRIDAFVRHLAPLAHRFDVWHAQDPLGANALADLADRGRFDGGALGGFVRTVHHLDRFDDARLAGWQLRSLERAHACFTVSRRWQRTLRDDHGIDAEVVPNGVDLGRYSAVPQPRDAAVVQARGVRGVRGARPGAPLVLAVGGIEARKNSRRLLDAFALLRRALPAAQLVIVGGASVLDHAATSRDFHAAVRAQRLGDAVRVTGPLPDDEMPAFYRQADVLAMPSLAEGFGLAVLEALACGTPVAVSRIAPFTEHLGDAPVHWCDPLDARSIAAALHTALGAPPFAAPPAVCRRFGWAASAERHLALYRRLAQVAVAPSAPAATAAAAV